MKTAMLIKISIFAVLTFLTYKESGPWTASTMVFLFLYIEAVGKSNNIITTKIADTLKDIEAVGKSNSIITTKIAETIRDLNRGFQLMSGVLSKIISAATDGDETKH